MAHWVAWQSSKIWNKMLHICSFFNKICQPGDAFIHKSENVLSKGKLNVIIVTAGFKVIKSNMLLLFRSKNSGGVVLLQSRCKL